MTFAFFQHIAEASPGVGRGMLAPKFALAVTPPTARDHRGDALVRASRKYGDRRPEAASDQCNLLGIDLGSRGKIRDCIACVRHLVETDNPPVLSFALTASSEVDPHRHVSPFAELLRHNRLALTVFVAAEAMQHDECRPALAWAQSVRSAHDRG